ncbi:MAG: SRPBCC family protein [Actinomycetota bacterium]|nr:SRPBCC family protein [Actinomycetota bacterium]
MDVRRELVIAAPADEVWSVVAAPERQAEWFPGMVSSVLENTDGGIFRTVQTASGGFIREEVLSVDHGARRFEYRIVGPFRMEHHLGRITVVPDPSGSLVIYEQELEPKALTYVLDGAVADALEGLRDLVVHGRTSRSWVEPVIATGSEGKA